MPGKADINPQTGKAYAINPATNQWDDNYWATVVEPMLKAGGAGAQGGTLADQLMNASMDSYNKQFDEYKKKSSEFDAANPFNFDKMLEASRAEVSTRLDPYYEQTLNDFLTGISTRKTRSVQDQNRLLKELNQDTETYTGDAKIALQKAIDNSREGFADSGLYGSGQQLRGEGEQTAASQRATSQFMEGQNRRESAINLAGTRTAEDLAQEEKMKRRDLAQEKSYTTESQSLSETLRKQQQREYEKAQFTGVPPGVNPYQYSTFTSGLLNT